MAAKQLQQQHSGVMECKYILQLITIKKHKYLTKKPNHTISIAQSNACSFRQQSSIICQAIIISCTSNDTIHHNYITPRMWKPSDIGYEQFKWLLKAYLFGHQDRGTLWLLNFFTYFMQYFTSYQHTWLVSAASPGISYLSVQEKNTMKSQLRHIMVWKTRYGGNDIIW